MRGDIWRQWTRKVLAAASIGVIAAASFAFSSPVAQANGDSCPGHVDVTALLSMAPGRLPDCFGDRTITVVAFAPRTDGLGGVGYQMAPRWLGPWAGAVVQATDELSGPDPGYGSGPFYQVFVAPDLGRCTITAAEADRCPFHAFLNGWVSVTGHFDDPIAPTCRATGPGAPNATQAAIICRNAFVVTALSAGLPPTSTATGDASQEARRVVALGPIAVAMTALFALAAAVGLGRRRTRPA